MCCEKSTKGWTLGTVPQMGIKAITTVQQETIMARKNYNFNTIRQLLVIAHNNGNKKPINKDMADGAGIDVSYLIQWEADVKALQKTVEDYVDKRKNGRFNADITEGDIYAARERIYPKWKEVLHCAEKEKDSRDLHVNEADVEDLIGFAWDFFDTGVGTGECHVDPKVFRRKVESLLGCMIAEKEMLTDSERDILIRYNKATKKIQSCIDTLAELDIAKKDWELKKSELPETEELFGVYIDNQIRSINDQIKLTEEQKYKAEMEEKLVSTDAKKIQLKIKYTGK